MPICFQPVAMAEDHRGDLLRIRLNEEDLARVGAIQDLYKRTGLNSSLTKVLSDAIDRHYCAFLEDGLVEDVDA